jgi:hypothetical protein
MPILRQSIDGHYFIRLESCFLNINTWQLDRQGFRYLQAFGIGLDQRFTIGLFNQLYRRMLVYYGESWDEYWKNRIHRLEPQGDQLSPTLLATFREDFQCYLQIALDTIPLNPQRKSVADKSPSPERTERLSSLIMPPGQVIKAAPTTPKPKLFEFGIPLSWFDESKRATAQYCVKVFVNHQPVQLLYLPDCYQEAAAIRLTAGQVRGAARDSSAQLWKLHDGKESDWVAGFNKRGTMTCFNSDSHSF